LENLAIDLKIILKCAFKKWDEAWIGLMDKCWELVKAGMNLRFPQKGGGGRIFLTN
jgi:hypothetical protein